MIVDAHAHVFLPAVEDPDRPVDDLAPADRSAPLELFEETMATHGVGAAVLVPLASEDGYVSSAVASDPDRYAGIAVWDGNPNPDETASRLDAGGFRGLRMFGFDSAGPPWPLLERLAADGRLLWLYPKPGDLTATDEICRRIPDLEVVLNHTGLVQGGIGTDNQGRPRIISEIPQPTEAATLSLARHRNVSVVLSGAYGFSHQPWPYADVGVVTQRVADAFGTDRLMWASDFPWVLDDPGYGAVLALVDHHLPGLSPGERASVRGDNARRIVWKET